MGKRPRVDTRPLVDRVAHGVWGGSLGNVPTVWGTGVIRRCRRPNVLTMHP